MAVNAGIGLELVGFPDLTDSQRKQLAQAFCSAVGRALKVVEEKRLMPPFKVMGAFDNKGTKTPEGVVLPDATLRLIVSAAGERSIIVPG